jgi:hypothetical protein
MAMISKNKKDCRLSGRSRLWSSPIKAYSALVLALFISSCTIPPVVESYRDPDIDYSAYKTFSFISRNVDKKGKAKEWSLEEKVLFPIIRADMESRGLTYTKKKEAADFAIDVEIVNRYKSEYVPERTVHSTSDTYLFHRADDHDGDDDHFFILPLRQPMTYGGYTEEYFQIYAELNFYDRKTEKKIWKGSGLYRADTYDMNIAAPPLISAILDRYRKLPEKKK